VELFRVLFVGEKRSRRAIDMGVTWKDGRLLRALPDCGIGLEHLRDHNLWYDDGELNASVVRWAKDCQPNVVALGGKASAELARLGIRHTYLTHTAARNRIRTTANYIRHVRQVLLGVGKKGRSERRGRAPGPSPTFLAARAAESRPVMAVSVRAPAP
jgi:hypothetical protein